MLNTSVVRSNARATFFFEKRVEPGNPGSIKITMLEATDRQPFCRSFLYQCFEDDQSLRFRSSPTIFFQTIRLEG